MRRQDGERPRVQRETRAASEDVASDAWRNGEEQSAQTPQQWGVVDDFIPLEMDGESEGTPGREEAAEQAGERMESASPDGHSRAESEERESETPLGATRRRAATGPVQFTFFRKQKGEDGVTRKVEVDGGDALACDIQQMTNSALRRALIAIDCSAGINTPAPKGANAKLQQLLREARDEEPRASTFVVPPGPEDSMLSED